MSNISTQFISNYNLKSINLDDLNSLKVIAQKPEMGEYFRNLPPIMDWNPATFIGSYWIYKENEKVGLITLGNLNPFNKSVEFGILIDLPASERRVAAYWATRQLAEYVYYYLGYNKLYCRILEHRTTLARFILDCGFKHEGNLRSNCFWKSQFWNEDLFSLLEADFKQLEVPKWAQQH